MFRVNKEWRNEIQGLYSVRGDFITKYSSQWNIRDFDWSFVTNFIGHKQGVKMIETEDQSAVIQNLIGWLLIWIWNLIGWYLKVDLKLTNGRLRLIHRALGVVKMFISLEST